MGHTSVEQTVLLEMILILRSSVISSVCLSFHVLWKCCFYTTMTSSNGNSFRVTGHLCGNSLVTGEFPAQRLVTRSIGVFFDLRLNKRLSKQSWGWWLETPSRPLWRQINAFMITLTWPIHLMVRSVLDYVLNRPSLIAWFISINSRASITSHINCFMWDIIIHPCLNFNS